MPLFVMARPSCAIPPPVFGAMLLNQGIVQDNLFLFPDAGEKGIWLFDLLEPSMIIIIKWETHFFLNNPKLLDFKLLRERFKLVNNGRSGGIKTPPSS